MRMSPSHKELAKAILKSISGKHLEEGASLISQELDRSVYSGWSGQCHSLGNWGEVMGR